MEYRRRKKTGSMRSRPRSRAQSSSGAGGMIVSLILIAGIVYIIVTSNAGEWVAREVMAPLFSAVSSIGDKANDAPSGLNNGSTTAGGINLSTGESTAAESANAVLPALNCYMLQMGVYSSHENAQKEAERLRALGAAGYIFADSSSGETRYRVIGRVSLLLCGTLGLCHTHPAVEQILGFAAIHSLLGKRIRLLEAVGERTVLKQMAVRDNRGSRVQQGGRT